MLGSIALKRAVGALVRGISPAHSTLGSTPLALNTFAPIRQFSSVEVGSLQTKRVISLFIRQMLLYRFQMLQSVLRRKLRKVPRRHTMRFLQIMNTSTSLVGCTVQAREKPVLLVFG